MYFVLSSSAVSSSSVSVTLRLLALLAGGVGRPTGSLAGSMPLEVARYSSRRIWC